MSQIAINEAAARLAVLVHQTPAGQEITLLQNDEPIAKLIPLQSPRKVRVKRGFAKGRVFYMAPDFDETPEGFKEYLA